MCCVYTYMTVYFLMPVLVSVDGELQMFVGDIDVMFGSTVTLTCNREEGANVEWYRNSEKLDGKVVTQSNSSSLTLIFNTPGVYQCEVNDIISTNIGTVTLCGIGKYIVYILIHMCCTYVYMYMCIYNICIQVENSVSIFTKIRIQLKGRYNFIYVHVHYTSFLKGIHFWVIVLQRSRETLTTKLLSLLCGITLSYVTMSRVQIHMKGGQRCTIKVDFRYKSISKHKV